MATTPVPTERRLVAEHIPFKPEELDFFAEEELVSILPKFTLRQEQGKLHLLDGAYGPLRANTPAKVPLWVALSLRRKNKARIQPPEWMSVANLEKVLEAERKGVDLQDMPHRYIEVAGLLLRFAPQDFGADLPKVRSTLRSIREVRMSKLEREVQEELNRTWAVKAIPLPISSMEANAIRPLLVAAIAQFRALGEAVEGSAVAAAAPMVGGEAGAGAAVAEGAGAPVVAGGAPAAEAPRRRIRRGG